MCRKYVNNCFSNYSILQKHINFHYLSKMLEKMIDNKEYLCNII